MKFNINYKILLIVLLIILIVVSILSIFIGKYDISIIEILSIIKNYLFKTDSGIEVMKSNVVLGLRMPRVFAAIIVGASLAISGVCYQGIFSNPLVSPDFLGVSSGACIGAAIAILLSLNAIFINLFAFISGIITVILTIFISKMIRYKSDITLVLSGIIIGTLMSSILGFIKYIADPETELASITYWTMGSFAYANESIIKISLIILIITSIVLYKIAWKIDILSTGDIESRVLGVDANMIRRIVIIGSTILTASSICIAGTIGWVGLIIPHFSRILVGSNNKKLIPIAMINGSIFMLLVDTLTRVITELEMPVSIITGFIGAPLFLLLLITKRKK